MIREAILHGVFRRSSAPHSGSCTGTASQNIMARAVIEELSPMREGFKEGLAMSESFPPETRLSSSFRVVIALSIPAYLAMTWAISAWLPAYSFLAVIPIALAMHSALILLSGKEE
jgi:hypothetical protein